jgi:lysophospholipase L1-like esterase
MVEIIAAIRARNISDIIVMGPGPYAGWRNWQASEQAELESYLTWLPAYCAAEGLYYYDMYAAVGDPSRPQYIREDFDRDGLHVNADGAAAIAYDIDAIIMQARSGTTAAEMDVMP